MNIPQRTEVIIVGGGNAGLSAAITARELGADVVLFEQAPQHMRGGNTRHTRNLRMMHNSTIPVLKGQYSALEYWQDLLRVTEGNINPELAKLMIKASQHLFKWLTARGVRFQPALSGTLSLERTNAFFLGGGKALLNAEYHWAEKIGVKIYYDCEVSKLVIKNGVFKSAHILKKNLKKKLNQDKNYSINADAIIITSGGFQANIDWLKQIWGKAAENFLIRGTPFNKGKMLKELMQQGVATVSDPTQCHAVAIDARSPKFDGGIVTRIDCISFSIVVNKQAQRFYDEGEDFWPKRYAIWGRLVAEQDEQIAFTIFDSKVIDQFMPSAFPPIRADSIRELAEKLALDPHLLEQTITQYNQAINSATYDPSILDHCYTSGITPKKSHWALTIDSPPFYAYPLRPGITFTYLGVKVNQRSQVIMENNKASKNIYAAGEIMAGNILGQGYCAGTGMTIGSVFGQIAGQEAVCQLKK